MSSNASGETWDDEADVVVVGFGGAGACAALEAAQHGASVLVLDRFHGGGATAGTPGQNPSQDSGLSTSGREQAGLCT